MDTMIACKFETTEVNGKISDEKLGLLEKNPTTIPPVSMTPTRLWRILKHNHHPNCREQVILLKTSIASVSTGPRRVGLTQCFENLGLKSGRTKSLI